MKTVELSVITGTNQSGTVGGIDATTAEFRANSDALDKIQLARIQADLETMMLRHGRGRIIGICVEAIKSSEAKGAKW